MKIREFQKESVQPDKSMHLLQTLLSMAACLIAIIASTQATSAYDPNEFPGKGDKANWVKASQLNLMANSLQDQGKYKEAVEQLKLAIAIYPYSAMIYFNYANALASQNLAKEAEASYKKAIELAPDFDKAYANMGDVLNSEKDYLAAESACKHALSLNQKSPAAMINLAESYLGQNKPLDARKYLLDASAMPEALEFKKAIADDLLKANALLEKH